MRSQATVSPAHLNSGSLGGSPFFILKPLRPLPTFKPLARSPELVRIMDAIRFGPLDELEEYAEFTWFIREYPRAYRHHFSHAEYRLRLIHSAYEHEHGIAAEKLQRHADGAEWTETVVSGGWGAVSPHVVYWDFESYLNAISSALDIAARVVGTAYRVETPSSFNRFCKSAPDGPLKDIFLRAQLRWVTKLKAYRDCFTHYTPVDTLLWLVLREYEKEWQLRAKLPVNPNVREILGFRYSKRVELLTYAVAVWRHLNAFDRAVAREIDRLYRTGDYPQRIRGLFFVGGRNL